DDPVQQRTVVGHQQQASRVAVEAADGRERRRAPPKARRKQIVDERAGIAGRAGVTGWLVQHQQQAGRWIERRAVDAYALRLDDLFDLELATVGVGDATVAKHRRHFLAAAVTQVRDQLEQLHERFALRASTILKPCCWITMRTRSKPAPSACS